MQTHHDAEKSVVMQNFNNTYTKPHDTEKRSEEVLDYILTEIAMLLQSYFAKEIHYCSKFCHRNISRQFEILPSCSNSCNGSLSQTKNKVTFKAETLLENVSETLEQDEATK